MLDHRIAHDELLLAAELAKMPSWDRLVAEARIATGKAVSVCPGCGKAFPSSLQHGHPQKYCTARCAHTHQRQGHGKNSEWGWRGGFQA